MALTEKIEIDKIEIVQQWYVQVRRSTTIEKDGVFVSRTFHRWVLNPDSDISNQEQKVKDICNTAWTQEVKDAYASFKASQEAELNVE
jgi:hypothetical protein